MWKKNASILKWKKVKVKSLSHLRLFATPWIVAHQAPLSMGFSRQEYWSGVPFPALGDLQAQGSKPGVPHCGRTPHHLSHHPYYSTSNYVFKNITTRWPSVVISYSQNLNHIDHCICNVYSTNCNDQELLKPLPHPTTYLITSCHAKAMSKLHWVLLHFPSTLVLFSD